MSDPVLNQGEGIIRTEGGMEYVSPGRYSVWLYLTNQRIIISRTLGGSAAYPLSHLTTADIIEYQPSPFSLSNFKLLRLSFDNGGAVLLGLSSDKSGWIKTIEEVKISAPELPFTSTPVQFTASSPSPIFRCALIAIIVLGFFTACILAFAVILYWQSTG